MVTKQGPLDMNTRTHMETHRARHGRRVAAHVEVRAGAVQQAPHVLRVRAQPVLHVHLAGLRGSSPGTRFLAQAPMRLCELGPLCGMAARTQARACAGSRAAAAAP